MKKPMNDKKMMKNISSASSAFITPKVFLFLKAKVPSLKPKVSSLSRAIAIAMSAMMVAPYSLALPTLGDFVEVVGDSDYSVAGNTGTLTITQDKSVVNFEGAGVDVASGEALTFTQTGGSSAWSLLVNDFSNSTSLINGVLDGDVRVFLVNQNGFVFGAGAEVSLASLVASTYGGAFDGDSVVFTAGGSTGGIEVQEVSSSVAGSQLVLVSSDIDIDGQVNLDGNLDLLAGESVVVSFSGNDLMQFNITQALATTSSDRLFDIARGGEVNAANVSMQARVSDPLSLVVNNRGIVRANGVDTSTAGVIRLVGTGGEVRSLGTLDTSSANGDGSIDISAGRVQLRGVIDAGGGALTATIGDGVDQGLLNVFKGTDVTLGSATITGVGTENTLSGLANYQVESLDAGSAGYKGAGTTDWANVGAITFSNFSILKATSETENTIEVQEGAGLSENVEGIASITGGTFNDRFLISGNISSADGSGGNDVFEMGPGGNVIDSIDGGADNDMIINVFDVATFDNNGLADPNGTNGESSFVDWTSIESFVETTLPPTSSDPTAPVFNNPTPAILAPQTPIDDIAGLGGVSLGLVADDNNLRLPCGHNNTRDLLTAEEHSAKEEDCFNKYGGPEYQKLISSIIHFDNDSHAITLASADRLNRVSTFVVESDMFERVVLSGHTDINASESYNMKLSSQRASAAGDYMQSQGVSSDMIETHAFGESLPAKSNDSEANRAFNRRVHVDLKK